MLAAGSPPLVVDLAENVLKPRQDYSYQVDNVEHSFTILCGTGMHEVALLGVVLNGFPQFSHHLGSVVLK